MKQMPDLYELRAQIDRIDRQIQAVLNSVWKLLPRWPPVKERPAYPSFKPGGKRKFCRKSTAGAPRTAGTAPSVLFTNLMDIASKRPSAA